MARVWFSRLFSRLRPERVVGEPASANGASSQHLIWEVPPDPLSEVSAVFELLVEPAVPRLYFFALQVSFLADGRHQGGAHLGLQWHPSYPESRAANWGGYGPDGRELTGSESLLPSTLGNPNTRDYRWRTGVPYRFRITRSEPGWRGTVTDLDSGEATVVRDLFSLGTSLASPLVWTEAFCRCEHPSVVCRWSELLATRGGMPVEVPAVRVSYQGYAQGGCTNTTARPDRHGIVQVTGVPREVAADTVLPMP